jgi:hypothetical protein
MQVRPHSAWQHESKRDNSPEIFPFYYDRKKLMNHGSSRIFTDGTSENRQVFEVPMYLIAPAIQVDARRRFSHDVQSPQEDRLHL